MNIFITYSNDYYAEVRNFCAKMARRRGKFDKVIVYKPEDIDYKFKKKYSNILNIKRGGGLWLWKPYIIYKALQEEAKEGDIVFYCDAASFFIRNCNHIITQMEQNIFVSELPFIEKQWTKNECFKSLNCVDSIYRETNQIQASFIGVRKNFTSVALIKEWLDACCQYELISDNYNPEKQCRSFLEHRYDQSILSLTCKIHNIVPMKDPTQYGRIDYLYVYPNNKVSYIIKNFDDVYPPCIILHRKRKLISLKVVRELLNAILPKFMVRCLWYKKYIYWSRYLFKVTLKGENSLIRKS